MKRPKKVVLLPEITHLPAYEYVSEYIFLILKKNNKKQKARRHKKAKEKEEQRITVENLTGYDDIVCEFALRIFTYLIKS